MKSLLLSLVGLSVLFLSLILPACSSAPVPLPQEILVGCLLPTSAAPTWGPNLIKAAQVAEEQVNSQGGIAGHPLKLIIQDEGPTPASSLYGAHKLIEANKVQVIIGGTTSDEVMALGPYVESKAVVLVSPSATSSALSKYGWSRWVFRIPPGDSLQGGVAAKIIKDKGYKKVAMLVQDTLYGRGIEEMTKQFLRGISETIVSQRYDPAKLSYLAELHAIQDKNPDCIFHAGYYDDGAVIYAQALKLGLDNVPWIAVDGVYDMPLDKYTDAARFMEKAVTGTVSTPDMRYEAYTRFAERYKALYGFSPTVYCDTTYDGVTLIADAIRRVSIYQGAAIRDALSSIGSNYHGISGMITFNSSGERLAGIYGIWEVELEGTQYQFKITGQPINFTRSMP